MGTVMVCSGGKQNGLILNMCTVWHVTARKPEAPFHGVGGPAAGKGRAETELASQEAVFLASWSTLARSEIFDEI